MRYLLILDAALFALAATMAITLGVVWIIYAFNAGISERTALEMQSVGAVTVGFTLITIPFAFAFWGLMRSRPWHWWAQLASAVTLTVCSLYLYRILSP